jgi:SARP family transcriptional regulator, regulator of embCAB operon
MAETSLSFGVLGPLLVSVDGTPVTLGAPKQRAVLAMLVINRNRPVATESLIDAVWGESPVPAARTTIHSHVSNLRRLIGEAGGDGRRVLVSAPPGYQLTIADTDCDLGRFALEKSEGIAAAAARSFEAASSHLSAALNQWRGEVLADLRDFGFVDPFATAVTEDKLWVHTARAEAEIACGRAHAVIGELESLTAQHPYREPLWAQLITAYYVTERQSDAIDAYRRLKTALADELGIDPGPTINTLYERILRQEPLDTKRAAQDTAIAQTKTRVRERTADGEEAAVAGLRDSAGQLHRLRATATRIGRDPDNEIVLNDTYVSRHHAAVMDTGSSFVIIDLRSANGVEVQGQRIHTTANLADGDQIKIGDHEFTFQIGPP